MIAILKKKPLIFMTQAGLFITILILGTIGALMLDETRGLALAEGHIRELVVGPEGRVYALTSDGLFVTNGDDDWRKLDRFPGIPVSLAVAPSEPQILYGGHSSNGAYRSGNGGRTWDHVGPGLGIVPGAALRVTALAVDDDDPQHVMAATAYGIGKRLTGGGIYESRSGGDDWTKLADVEELITDLTFNDGTIYAATEEGLKRYGEPESPQMNSPWWSNLRS